MTSDRANDFPCFRSTLFKIYYIKVKDPLKLSCNRCLSIKDAEGKFSAKEASQALSII